jgi:chemotaxis response regulator CheB
LSLRVFVLVGQPLTRQAVEEALAPISAQLHVYHDPIAAVPAMQDAAWDAVVIETVFLDGESINQLLLMMSRRNLPLVSIGDRAKAESHLFNYPAARDHVTLLGTVTRGDCQPLMLRLASLLKRLVQSNKPADAYSDFVDPATLAPEKTGEPARISAGETEVELLVIGVSAGGPDVLAEIFRHLHPLRVPMLIAQHMPADHTASFAAHLAREFKIPVVECGDGPIPPVGSVGLLKGGRDFALKRFQDCLTLRPIEASDSNAHPNIDTLLRSAAKAGIKALPIILTGMGRDGASGSKLLEDQGMPVWVQTPASCTVAGMPLATLEEVSNCAVLAPDAIARRLNNLYGFAETKYSAKEQGRL